MKQALRTFLKEKQNQQSVYRSSDDMVHTITESMGGEQIVGGEEADYGQVNYLYYYISCTQGNHHLEGRGAGVSPMVGYTLRTSWDFKYLKIRNNIYKRTIDPTINKLNVPKLHRWMGQPKKVLDQKYQMTWYKSMQRGMF